MAFLNYAKKEISAKIVFYGPGLSGKTTNLEWIHRKLQPDRRGKLISLETRTDRTLFFDFLPVQLGEIKGFQMRFNVYTVPGQIFYNETRKMVLKGVDGVVFVADSQKEMANENIESLKNLEENLKSHGRRITEIPLVFQYNKRDLPKTLSLDELNRVLNPRGLPFFEATAIQGDGVLATLTRITRMVAERFQHSEKSLFSVQARPAPVVDMPVIPVSDTEDIPPPRVIPFPSGETTAAKKDVIAQADLVPDMTGQEPEVADKSLDVLGAPAEEHDASLSEIGPLMPADPEPGTRPGEDIPSIGDLSTPSDFLVPRMVEPKASWTEPAPSSEETRPRPPREPRAPSKGQPQSRKGGYAPTESFGIDPSLRVLARSEPDAGPPDARPDVHIGKPEKVGETSVQIPLSFTFPGSDRSVSLVLSIDLKPAHDKKKK